MSKSKEGVENEEYLHKKFLADFTEYLRSLVLFL